MTGVKPLKELLRILSLKWLGQFERMSKEKAPEVAMKIAMKGKKKEKPKTRWMEVIEKDMRRRGLQRGLAKKK